MTESFLGLGEIKGAFFWDYSGIGILGVEGIPVLFGAIPFSAPDSRVNRMNGIGFTRNRQNTRSFGKFLGGNPTRPRSSAIFDSGHTSAYADAVVLRSPPP